VREDRRTTTAASVRPPGRLEGRTAIRYEQVTLVAAGVAALASVVTLAGTLLGDRRAEMRAAHRQALLSFLPELGEGVHETAASATIIRRRFAKDQDPGPWVEAGKAGANKLKSVRPNVKYTLYGLDEPIRTLSRMPEWIATYKNVPKTNADDLLKEMQKLAAAVDGGVRRSYRRGLPPGLIRRWWLRRRTSKVRKLWGERFDAADPRA
jgi:hypothetical protein